MYQKIQDILKDFSSISLYEMNSVSLMKRTDTKFVINESQLVDILKNIGKHYKVLEIESNRIMTYSSLYFDTEDNSFYKDHHNGKNNRIKVRQRKYVESDICFLEVKQKNGNGETNKSRIPLPNFELNLSQLSINFVQTTTNKELQLKASLWNKFNRITLVNLEGKERITLDLNLSYKMNEAEKKYDNLVIVEVKQERFNRNSKIVKTLKSIKQHPYSISKYCIGMINIYNHLKYNIFKRKLIKINKTVA